MHSTLCQTTKALSCPCSQHLPTIIYRMTGIMICSSEKAENIVEKGENAG